MKPVLYLTNVASLRSAGHAGPGRTMHAMARPPAFVNNACDGLAIPALAPDADENAWIMSRAKAGELTPQDIADYKDATTKRVQRRRRAAGGLGPDRLCLIAGGIAAHAYWVRSGDTIVCTCPRLGSPKRTHECHLEWLAPLLIEDGWLIVLYGQTVNMRRSA